MLFTRKCYIFPWKYRLLHNIYLCPNIKTSIIRDDKCLRAFYRIYV